MSVRVPKKSKQRKNLPRHAQNQGIEMLREAIRPDEGKIPAFIFASPEIYQWELERIFMKCWLFVAHETEVRNKGDYVTRSMGEDPVIVVRADDGRVRVFLNVCRHRGMRVCQAELGNSSNFCCPYHGFTYKNSGELIGMPFEQDAFGNTLDKSQLGLIQARVESYQGLIFATWDQQVGPLQDCLGDMRWYLDLVVGRAEMEVVGPPQKWELAANWKLAAENFMSDAYHTAHTHASIGELGLVPSLSFAKAGYHIYSGNGNGLGLGTGMPGSPDILAPELFPVFERTLSKEQYLLLKQMRNLHGTVFPNLSFLVSALTLDGSPISHTTLRQWQPKGPGKMEISSWFLVEKEALDQWKERSRQAYIISFGSSGMFEQDDTENWSSISENCRGVMASRTLSFFYQMGLERSTSASFSGPGQVYDGKFCEANARAFYRHWLELMLVNT